MKKLIEADLLTLVNTQREMTPMGNGANVHHYIIHAKLKEPT